jgi:hypothetical protein
LRRQTACLRTRAELRASAIATSCELGRASSRWCRFTTHKPLRTGPVSSPGRSSALQSAQTSRVRPSVQQARSLPVGAQALGFAVMAARDAGCHCGQLQLEVEGGLDLQLPCLPASERKRLRDPGGVQGRSSAGQRTLQRLRRRRRGGPKGAHFDPIRDEPAFQDLLSR